MIDWTLNTLGSFRDHGYGLIAFCSDRPCMHYAALDLDRLVDRLGADFPTVDRQPELLAALRCGRCGGKGMEIRVKAPTGVFTTPSS